LDFHDLDGDGKLELALPAGFYFDESSRGGELFLLRQPTSPGDPWPKWQIAADPVVHRVRWGDLDGNGQKELVHAPIFGPGSQGAVQPKPAHLWAFQILQPWRQGKVHTIKNRRNTDSPTCGLRGRLGRRRPRRDLNSKL
jgi:hypothetical protein